MLRMGCYSYIDFKHYKISYGDGVQAIDNHELKSILKRVQRVRDRSIIEICKRLQR